MTSILFLEQSTGRRSDLMFRGRRALIVPDPRGRIAGGHIHCVDSLELSELLSAEDMAVVPDFLEDGAILASASEIGHGTRLGLEGILELAEAVGGRVRWVDAGSGKHLPGRELLEGTDYGEVEVDDVLVLFIVWAIASHIIRGRAGGVLRELQGDVINRKWPRSRLRRTSCPQKSLFGAPWLIQYLFTWDGMREVGKIIFKAGRTVVEEIQPSKLHDEGLDRWALVWRDCGAVRQHGGRWIRIILPR